MATYYIDPATGNDANAGTSQGSPWKTIPGTRNAGDTAYVSAAWGSFNGTTKVPVGTVFKIKSGSTFDSVNSGHVRIDTTYYTDTTVSSFGEMVSIERDDTWGSGAVTFDGTGITASAGNTGGHIECRCNGISIDGKSAGGFTFNNCRKSAIYFRERAGDNSPMNWGRVMFVNVFNHGTINVTDSDGATTGGIRIRRIKNLYVSNLIVNGNSKLACGIAGGDNGSSVDPQYEVENATIEDCEAYNLTGGGTDDSGVGFKMVNGINLVYRRCKSHDNLKGWDDGEQSAASSPVYNPAFFLTTKIINCEAWNCTWGININSAKNSMPNKKKVYLINTLVRDCTLQGSNIYSGPLEVFIVHCVYANIGSGAYNGSGDDCALRVQNDNTTDTWEVTVHVYNSIIFKPRDCPYVAHYFMPATGHLTWDYDYITHVQDTATSDRWCQWSYSNIVAGTIRQFLWSEAVGAGTAWATTYGKDATPPTNGSGHFGCDVNSYKILGGAPEASAFWEDAVRYIPNTKRVGVNLTGKPWYISEMGTDKDGNTRTAWRNGMFDPVFVPPPPGGGGLIQRAFYWFFGPP